MNIFYNYQRTWPQRHSGMRKRVYLTLLLCLLAGPAAAVDPVFTALFSDKAIRGYDTVAYFTENQAVEGSAEYATEYQGATWLFSSQEHLDLFLADPEKYAPQYGGYCAYAVSQNQTASIKPELFTIVDGKLYLNYNESINDKWRADKINYIEAADKNWPGLLED